MKPLLQSLRKNSHDYSLAQRGKKACIYEQRFNGKLISYEVFLIKIAPEKEFKEKIIESRERFPNNEAFGNWAWTITSWDRALLKFNEMENSKGDD